MVMRFSNTLGAQAQDSIETAFACAFSGSRCVGSRRFVKCNLTIWYAFPLTDTPVGLHCTFIHSIKSASKLNASGTPCSDGWLPLCWLPGRSFLLTPNPKRLR